jgi:hypothetical protein
MSYTNGLDTPSDYFSTKLYTGTGANQSITGVGHQPDLVWIKDRTNTNNQVWTDSVRGVEKVILSNANNAETTYTDGLVAFTSDGFNLGDDDDGQMNVSGNACVSWNWKAGGSASSNTDGSITSTVSANTTAGFSIVKYTGNGSAGATLGHGLGVAPSVIILKGLVGSREWAVYHTGLGGNTFGIHMNTTAAKSTETSWWNSTSPTSSVFTIGTSGNANDSGNAMIAYCFAEKKGFSKFGSYTGNGSTDGVFCFTGMRPAWIMGKRTDSANNWYMFDSTRNTSNPTDKKLRADTSDAENVNSSKTIDILSNGFKLRSSDEEFNASGGSYIFMAFAENPFVTSTGIPTTAR